MKCKGNKYREILLTDGSEEKLQDYIKHERGIDQEALDQRRAVGDENASSDAMFLPATTRSNLNRTGRLTPDMINKLVKSVSERANKELKDGEKISGHPHMLRHTHAISLVKSGRQEGYIANRLGHRSVDTTRKYTAPSEETEREYIEEAEIGK